MKKLLLILILGLTINSYAQNIQPFNEIFTYLSDTGVYDETVYSVVSTDSNYFLLMLISNDSINRHLVLVKTDLYGNEIAHKDLASDTSGHYLSYPDNSLLLDKDTNLLLLGVHWYSNVTHGQVIKLNLDLDILWGNVYQIPDSLMGDSCVNGRNIFTAIRQTFDGGYILNGYYYLECDYTQNVQKMFLQKIDVNGNTEWIKLYPNLHRNYDIELANDSGYYAPTGSTSNNIPHLQKFDKYGNKEYQINNVPHMSIAVLDSNHIIAAATFWVDNQLEDRAIELAKVNLTTKSIVWKKKYYPAKSVRQLHLHQNINLETRNGFIYFASSAVIHRSSDTTNAFKGLMMKLNSNGDSLWSHYYGYDTASFHERSQFNDFCFISENEIIAVGYFNYRNPDYSYCRPAWIVKMDSNGVAPRMQTVEISELKNYNNTIDLKAYPNPTTNNITISTTNALKNKAELIVYNTIGQVVLQKHINKGKTEVLLHLEILKKGVYIFELRDKYGLLGRGKIIKE